MPGREDMDLLMEASWTGSGRFETVLPVSPKAVLDLPPELVRELSDSFELFDRNGDGKISEEELGAVMRSLGQNVSGADLQKLIADVDVNGDGCIDLYEFIALNTRPVAETESFGEAGATLERSDSAEAATKEALMSAFSMLDADNNGFISAEELHRVLVGFGDERVSLEECRQMIGCVDGDGDQMVDFREFETMMTGTCAY